MNRFSIICVAVLLAAFGASPLLSAWSQAKSQTVQDASLNPRNFSGVWWVDDPGPDKLLDRGRHGDASKCQTCHIPEHTMPEPPLTPWAMENLVAPNEKAHGAIGKFSDTGMSSVKRETCDPVGVPAQYWFTQLSPFEIILLPDRILQFFEAHREYRTIWLNRDHPAKLDPSYMGDSVGKWEGDTLVVDTIGFNGKDMIEPVGVNHMMSDSFHLVERWRRPNNKNLQVELTYYDPKVWGDKPWGGLKKQFILQPGMELMEEYCNPADNKKFDEMFMKAAPALEK